MPPFGNLYGMQVFVSHSLAEDEEIAFNAGDHSELFKLAYEDFAGSVKPPPESATSLLRARPAWGQSPCGASSAGPSRPSPSRQRGA